MENFSKQEFEIQKEELVRDLSAYKTSSKKPVGYLIVGQPGAGKSTMADIFVGEHSGNICFVSGDDYRRYHPHFSELQKRFGNDAVHYTQKFAGQMTEALIEALSRKKYNLIIEGTLRTTKVPLQTKALLVSRFYDVSLNVLLVRPEVSYLSTIKRYREMKALGGMPRFTPKEHHDLVVNSIIDNLDFIYRNYAIKQIRVFTREHEVLYDMQKTPQSNPADLFRKEFSRPLYAGELEAIHQHFDAYAGADVVSQVLEEYAEKAIERSLFKARQKTRSR